MINHNGVQLLNTVWYGCCGSNDDHKYPAVAFMRDDKETEHMKRIIEKTWPRHHNTHFIVWRWPRCHPFSLYVKNMKIHRLEPLDTAAFYNAYMWWIIYSFSHHVSILNADKKYLGWFDGKYHFNILDGEMCCTWNDVKKSEKKISRDWFSL